MNHTTSLPRVVVTADFYLPAFRNGGPIRSIASLIERMGDEFHFSVLCREPHLVGSPLPPEQKGAAWVCVGKARVKYLSSRQLKFLRLRSLLKELDADVFYVNGFFSPFTRLVLTLRLLGLLPKRRFVLVPHGEFSHGAISLKSAKKRAYIRVARAIGLYKDLIWQATSEPERDDILRWLPKVTRTHKDPVIFAPNLPALVQQDGLITDGQCKEAGSLRVIFLSRIHPIKNLDYALEVLGSSKGTITFDIYGPLEDAGYWRKCEGIIRTLPENIRVQYRGEVRPENVRSVFSEYHFFLFPTRSENFGYVIIEALGAGCPVATSDQTPWKDLREKNAGWWLPLSRPEEYRAIVEKMLAMDGAEFAAMSQAGRAYASTLGDDPGALEAYRRLFGARIHNE